MFNIAEELTNFKPIDLENIEQKIGAIPDDMKNAMELYNKALNEISNKNEDIAIIALKKAISIYPEFYEAMNLMGICYIAIGEEENAREIFNKVIQMDDNSLRAARYIKRLDGDISDDEFTQTRRIKKLPDKLSSISKLVSNELAPSDSKTGLFKYILVFILGVLITSLIWIAVPNNKVNIELSNLFNKPTQDAKRIEELEGEISELNSRLNEAQGFLEAARENEKQLQGQMDQYIAWSKNLRELDKLYYQGKYRELVVEIEKNLAGLDIPDVIKQEITALSNEAKPKSVLQFYETARSLYNSNSKSKDLDTYRQSADEYRMAISIIEELEDTSSYVVEIYYYGGKAIALSESPSKEQADAEAINCFETIISKWPNSVYANYSRARINELEAGKTIKH
ncbi:MAG: tetratricopeptide repeat protein [Clostridiaceae bacterium]|nr:tetratricopeptide repeat protein [Clostridiaceae bacterium]